MRRLAYVILLLCTLSLPAGAYTLDTLRIKVLLQHDGTAQVTERRYYIDRTNVSQSGDYDHFWKKKKYKLKLVQGFTDYDGFLHCFYTADTTKARYVSVVFKTKEGQGLNNFKDNIVNVRSLGNICGIRYYRGWELYARNIKQGESIVVMMQFKKGFFRPAINHKVSFVKTMKNKGIKVSDGGQNVVKRSKPERKTKTTPAPRRKDSGSSFTVLQEICFVVIVALIVLFFKPGFEKWMGRKKMRPILYGITGGIGLDKIPPSQALPLRGSLLKTFAVMNVLDYFDGNLSLQFQSDWPRQQLFAAFLLRMIHKKIISLDVDNEGQEAFRISVPVPLHEVSHEEEDDDEEEDEELNKAYFQSDDFFESQLWHLLYRVADEEHLLQPQDLETQNIEYWLQWEYIEVSLTTPLIEASDITKEDARQVIGFRNYLKAYGREDRYRQTRTSNWKEYMVFACLFGIEDQLYQVLQERNPRIINEVTVPQNYTSKLTELSQVLSEMIKVL